MNLQTINTTVDRRQHLIWDSIPAEVTADNLLATKFQINVAREFEFTKYWQQLLVETICPGVNVSV